MRLPLLQVRDLRIAFNQGDVVKGISFNLALGEKLALVGESGSGKSLTVRSVLGLIPKPARIVAGSVRFRGQELTTLPPRTLARLRGGDMALVFQDPMTSWYPVKRIGAQIGEALQLHGKAKGWRAEVARLLGLVAHRLAPGQEGQRHGLRQGLDRPRGEARVEPQAGDDDGDARNAGRGGDGWPRIDVGGARAIAANARQLAVRSRLGQAGIRRERQATAGVRRQADAAA